MGEGIRRSGIDRWELFLVTKVNFKSYEHAEQTVMLLKICKPIILTCCFCIGYSPTTTRRGGRWKSCMGTAESVPSAFPTSSPTGFLT